jgi:hypothetical protein
MNALVIAIVGLSIIAAILILGSLVCFAMHHFEKRRRTAKATTKAEGQGSADCNRPSDEGHSYVLPSDDAPSSLSCPDKEPTIEAVQLRCSLAGCPVPDLDLPPPSCVQVITPPYFRVHDYTFYSHLAEAGEELSFQPDLQYRPDELKFACDTTKGCVGFESNGTLYKSVNPSIRREGNRVRRVYPDGVDGAYVQIDHRRCE